MEARYLTKEEVASIEERGGLFIGDNEKGFSLTLDKAKEPLQRGLSKLTGLVIFTGGPKNAG